MFGAKLLNMNPSGDHIDEMEGGDGAISLDESRSNKVHLVHLIDLRGIKECVSLLGFDPALYRSRLFTFRPRFFTIRFIVDADGISFSENPSSFILYWTRISARGDLGSGALGDRKRRDGTGRDPARDHKLHRLLFPRSVCVCRTHRVAVHVCTIE